MFGACLSLSVGGYQSLVTLLGCFRGICRDGDAGTVVGSLADELTLWGPSSAAVTSSTAQGGGGSFKNRKPIGEVGCCESGMAERSQ